MFVVCLLVSVTTAADRADSAWMLSTAGAVVQFTGLNVCVGHRDARAGINTLQDPLHMPCDQGC